MLYEFVTDEGFQSETPLEKLLYPVSEKDLVDTSDEISQNISKSNRRTTEQAEDRILRRSRDPTTGLHLLKEGDLVVKLHQTRGGVILGTAKTLQYRFTGPH